MRNGDSSSTILAVIRQYGFKRETFFRKESAWIAGGDAAEQPFFKREKNKTPQDATVNNGVLRRFICVSGMWQGLFFFSGENEVQNKAKNSSKTNFFNGKASSRELHATNTANQNNSNNDQVSWRGEIFT